jgi:hypothetical protein
MSLYIRILGVASQLGAEVVQPTSPCGWGHDQFLPLTHFEFNPPANSSMSFPRLHEATSQNP